MPLLLDARLDVPLLNNSFNFSRYPTFRARNTKPLNIPNALRPRVHGRNLFASRGSLFSTTETHGRLRNVPGPQPTSSETDTRESWSTVFESTYAIDSTADLSGDNVRTNIHVGLSNAAIDTSGVFLLDDADLEKTPHTVCEDIEDSGWIETSASKSERESLYSMDSADLDAHPLLLSIPIIPQIKLERKATVRKPDPALASNVMQSHGFLSPRIPDLRTPARMSSRRYGRVLGGHSTLVVVCNSPVAKVNEYGTITSRASRQRGSTSWSEQVKERVTKLASRRSVSVPTLSSPYTSNDEREPLLKDVAELPHSALLSSVINEAISFPCPQSDGRGSDTIETPKPGLIAPGHAKHNHQWSSISHSTSFSNAVHAVVASLDPLPKSKPRSPAERKPVPNAHDPTYKWVPKNGRIIIKVFVPSTDDIWMFRVPQDISLVDFTSKVVSKLGFVVSFSGSVWDGPKYFFRTDERFKSWVKGRIRFGRNLPIVAHVLAPIPLVRLSVDADGCEVWCYA